MSKRLVALACVALLLFVCPNPVPIYAQIGSNLISCWTLEDGYTDAVTGSANDLTENGTVDVAAGKIGNAADLELGDAADFLSRADNASLSVDGDVDFAILAWVRMESEPVGAMTVVSKAGAAASSGEFILDYSGSGTDRFRWFVSNGASYALATNTGAPTTATDYMLLAWHDATANTINIERDNNGTVNSTAFASTVPATASAFQIGANNSASLFDGWIDEVAFFKTLPDSTMQDALWNSGAGVSCATIIGGVASGPPAGSLMLLGVGR